MIRKSLLHPEALPGPSQTFNPLTTNVPYHTETSPLICNANQLIGFYMMGNIGRNGLRLRALQQKLKDKVAHYCKGLHLRCLLGLVYTSGISEQIRFF